MLSRRRRRRALIAICTLLAAVLALTALVHTPWVRARVLSAVLARLAPDGTITATGLDYRLLALRFEITGLEVRSPDRQLPYFTVDRLVADLPWSVLRGDLALQSLTLEKPRFQVRVETDGTSNFVGERTRIDTPVRVDRLSITDLQISWQDARYEARLDAGAIDAEVVQNDLDASSLRVAAPARAALGDLEVSVRHEGGKLGWNGLDVLLDRLAVSSGPLDLSVDGAVERPLGDTRLDVHAQADARAGEIARLAGYADLQVDGEARLEADATGPPDAAGLDARLTVPALTAAGVRVAGVAASARGAVTPAPELAVDASVESLAAGPLRMSDLHAVARVANSLELEQLAASVAGGEVHVSGRVALDAAGDSSVRADWSGLRLDELLPPWATGRLGRTATAVSGRAVAGWPGTVPPGEEAVRVVADARLVPLPTRGLRPSGSLSLSVAAGGWSAEGSLGLPGGTTLRGSLSAPALSLDSPLHGRLALRAADLAALQPLLERARGRSLPGDLAGAATLEGTLSGSAGSPRLTGNGTLEGVRFAGSGPVDATASLEATADGLSLRDGTFDTAGGRLRVDVDATLDGALEGHLQADDLDLEKLVAATPPAWRPASLPAVEGSAALDLHLSGGAPVPAFAGEVTVHDLRVGGAAPLDVALRLSPAGDATRVDSLHLTSGDNSVAARGIVRPTERLLELVAEAHLGDVAGLVDRPELQPIRGVDAEAALALDPIAGSVSLDLWSLRVDLEDHDVTAVRPAWATWDADGLAVGDLRLRFGDTTLAVDGALRNDGSGDGVRAALDGDLSRFAESATVALRALEPDPSGLLAGAVELRGRLHAAAWVRGTPAAPTLDAELRVDDGRLAIGSLPAVEDVQVVVGTEGNALRIDELSARVVGATVSAEGTIPQRLFLPGAPAEPDDVASLRVHFTGLSASALAPYLPAERLRETELDASGTLDATASPLVLAATRAELRLDVLDLRTSGVHLRQARPTRLVLEDSRLRIADWEWRAETEDGAAGTTLTVTGVADLSEPDPRLDLAARGDLRLAVLTPLLPAGTVDGRAALELDVGGTLAAPRPEGRIVLSDVGARYPSPRLALDDLSGTIQLDAERIRTDGIVGTLNGGDIRFDLDLDIRDPFAPRGLAGITGRAVALETAGVRVSSNIDISVSARGPEPPRAFGSITLLEGGYRTRASLAAALRQATSGATTLAAPPTAEPTLLDRLQLDVRVVSQTPLVMDAPFADLAATVDVRVTGTATRPGVVGRAEIDEGGRVYLSGNTFSIERGVIEFSDPSAIRPTVDMEASTRINEYAVTIELSGDAFAPTLDARASAEHTPDLGQADTLSLIATGRTLREAGGQGSQVLREQAFAFLTGQLGGVTESLGLGRLRLQQAQTVSDNPFIRSDVTELFPRTTDLATRLTFTRSFGKRFELTFSQNLTEAGQNSWAGSLELPWDVQARAGIFDNDTRVLELRHQLVFGRSPEASRAATRPPRVHSVAIDGDLVLSEGRLRDRLRLRPGDDFDFLDWQRDQDRLRQLYWQEGYLEARVRPRRLPVGEASGASRPDAVDLRYEVRPGPPTRLRVEGFAFGDSTLRAMRTAWSESIATDFLLDDLVDVARRELVRRGYPRPAITASVTTEMPVKEIVVDVDPGPRAADMEILFDGNDALSDGRLRDRLKLADARQAAWYEPRRVVEAIEGLYAEQGYLAARVSVEGPGDDVASGTVTVHVDEGPAFRIAELRFLGNEAFAERRLRSAAGYRPGERYTPAGVDEILAGVTALYLEAGFNGAQVVPVTRTDRAAGTVGLELQIDEGPQQVLGEVSVSGRHRTRRAVVDHAIAARVGEPIGLREVERIRRRLYAAGAFQQVDVGLESLGPEQDGREPVRLQVRVVELPMFELRYGLQVLDLAVAEDRRETKPGLGALITHHDFLGVGASATVLGRWRTDETFGRASLSFPRLLGLPVRSTLIAQQARRDITRPAPFEPAHRTETVFQLQQTLTLSSPLSAGYSFEFERSRTTLPEQPAFGSPTDVTRLIPYAVYDTRDDLLHPRRGLFHSSALEMALHALGSDLRFLKYTANQYAFLPWRGLVFATAVRFGTGHSLDPASDALPISEFFLVGGATTVRGYPDGSLGRTPFFGSFFPGGDAMLVFNEEVRFPIWRWVHGVGFVDAGRTFTSLSELSLGDLPVSTGAGLRLVTPYGVLRLDYGYPLSTVDGVDGRHGRFHFGIGHIF